MAFNNVDKDISCILLLFLLKLVLSKKEKLIISFLGDFTVSFYKTKQTEYQGLIKEPGPLSMC